MRPLSRKERAEQTRLRMIQAAYRLFLEHGYEATTMQAVADASGVAVQTVYYTFKTKARLLADVESFAVLGDRPSTQWREADWVGRLGDAATVDQLISAFVTIDTAMKARLAPFVMAVGPALPTDRDSVARREAGQREFFGFFLSRLAQLGSLRPGLTMRRALDILQVVNSLAAYIELTARRGWTSRQWRAWVTYTIDTQFLSRDR
jgi:AcrR family transcriptional regulator